MAEISKVFDPLGLALPVMIAGRLLMQLLWGHRPKLEWDDTLPEEYVSRVLSYLTI